jgi:streptogramin lyase
VVAEIKTPSIPCLVETGFGSVWVTLCEGQGLLRINPETNKIATELDAGGGLAVFGGGSVWTVLDDQPDHPLARIDSPTNKVTEVPLAVAPWEIVYGDGTLWVVSNEPQSVLRLDPETHKVIAKIPVPTEWGTLQRADFAAGSCWLTETNKVVAQINVGGIPLHLDATDDGVWVKPQPDRLVRIEPETNKVTQEIKVPTGEYAGDHVVAHGSVWSANWDEGSVWRIDPDGK